jgi:hypothetical protein
MTHVSILMDKLHSFKGNSIDIHELEKFFVYNDKNIS